MDMHALHRADIRARVKEVVSYQLRVDVRTVQDGARFRDDLGADSLAVVELVLAFEEEFEIDIPDEYTEDIGTVGDAIAYIESHLDGSA